MKYPSCLHKSRNSLSSSFAFFMFLRYSLPSFKIIVGVPLMNFLLRGNFLVSTLSTTVIIPNTIIDTVGFHQGLSSVVASSAAIEPIVIPVM